jgi:MFS family permease
MADTHRIAERPVASELFDWRVLRAATSLATISFGYGGITSYAAIVAVQRHITPHSIYFTVFAITIVVVRVLTSRLGDRFGPHTILYPAFAAIPLAFVSLAVATSRPLFVVSAVLFGLGLGSVWPAFMSIMIERSDPRRRARTFGSVIWAFDTGIGAGSFAIGAIGQRWGLSAGFAFAAALSCMAIPIFVSATKE